MHQTIAKELLKTYRNGRRMAEFDLPDVAIYHCDQYGAYIYDYFDESDKAVAAHYNRDGKLAYYDGNDRDEENNPKEKELIFGDEGEPETDTPKAEKDDQSGTITRRVHPPSCASALGVGDELILKEQYQGEMRYVGGVYRDVRTWDKHGNGLEEVNIPRRFRITNVEYKYNGALACAVKALEVSFTEAESKARNNGQLNIQLDHRGIPLN
jgi:hypothetical protein